MDWTIRPGRISDVEFVLRLWVEGQAEPGHTDDADSLRRLISHDPSALILAEDDGRLVGSVIAVWDGWRGSIYRLVVAPSYRRHGLAGCLLNEAEAQLQAAGAVRLQAIVVETQSMAAGFWHASDWEEQSHRLRFVKG